jgi:ATP-dependent phosphofructokinase / diphosphate-dependent phosphofructokinase
MPRQIGILTSGGDCPGLNAAIRGVGKAARDVFHMEIVGFRDGFRGLVYDRTLPLESNMLSGILTSGGTILGTSRDKPHQMEIGGEIRDMSGAIVDTYARNHLDAVVCIGGGGTQKNALRLKEAGLNVITLPKTIDNDITGTDVSLGFDTALGIATEAIDRLHSTATSHHRIIVVELMGHRAGWLALGAGVAGGADVILIPEIPYHLDRVAEAIRDRARAGKRFSIVAVAEGAMSLDDARLVGEMLAEKQMAGSKSDKKKASSRLAEFHQRHLEHTVRLTEQLEKMTGQESRMTILGHLQRGGTPSPADRLLGTRLGAGCAECLDRNVYGVMLAARGDGVVPVPLEEVAGKKKFVPLDHPWVQSAKLVGASFGG